MPYASFSVLMMMPCYDVMIFYGDAILSMIHTTNQLGCVMDVLSSCSVIPCFKCHFLMIVFILVDGEYVIEALQVYLGLIVHDAP